MMHPIKIDSAGGEYMESVLVLEWTRAPGERIEAGETIAVVETAKASTEIEASHSGVLADILVPAGQEAAVGAPLGHISDQAAAALDSAAEVATPHTATPVQDGTLAPPASPVADRAEALPSRAGRVVATPLARRLARERGIDLSTLTGTGPRGRIKERDIDASGKATPERAVPTLSGPSEAAIPSTSPVARAEPNPRPAPFSQPTRSAVTTSSVDRESGAPIVLIHGFGADRSAWRQVTPLLSPQRRIILVELPGHGEAQSDAVDSIEAMALVLSDQLQALGVDEAHLVGHSLGGAAALVLTQLGQLAIRTLTLIAPGGLGPEIDAGFLNGFVAATRPESLDPWLARMVADPSRLPSGFAGAILRQRETAGTRDAQRHIVEALFPDGVQGMKLRPAFEGLSMPAKVLWGTKDAIIPHTHGFGAPGSVALHLLPGVGHVPMIECPALVARLIEELVRAQS